MGNANCVSVVPPVVVLLQVNDESQKNTTRGSVKYNSELYRGHLMASCSLFSSTVLNPI